METNSDKHWYVVQVHFMTESVRKMIEGMPVKTYVPILKPAEPIAPQKKKEAVRRDAPSRPTLLTFNYAFFYGTEKEVKDAVSPYSKMHMLYYRKDNSKAIQQGRHIHTDYMIVRDKQMEMFMKTVSLYSNGAPIADVDTSKLSKGDHVLIIEGPFAGVEGTLVTQKGKDGGKVVVSIDGVVNISTLDIEPQYIKVLKFASDNKHIYKKLDSFQPFVQDVLKRKLEGKGLSEEEQSRIKMFVRRFSGAETESINMRARLTTLVFMSYVALGFGEHSLAYYNTLRDDILPQLKSPRAKALIEEQFETYAKLHANNF